MLANSKAHTSRFISANLPCNKFKNRLVNIMPYELTRVCLQPIRGVEGSDYINASFLDGYRSAYFPHPTVPFGAVVCFWLGELRANPKDQRVGYRSEGFLEEGCSLSRVLRS